MAVETLTAELVGKSTGYSEMMKGAIEQANSWGSTLQQAGTAATAAMRTAGMAVTKYVTTPLLGAAAAGVGAFANFDKAMVESQAIMSLSGDQAQRMSSLALDLALQGTKGPEEMARSYFYLASAGLDAEQSIAALPQMMKFAQAGAFDMARATDLATDAQSALGMTVKDAGENLANLTRVTDVLSLANNLANASIEQFSVALTTDAGASLKTVNKSIEEGTAVLAAYADQGIKGQLAGGSLGRVLRLLSQSAMRNTKAHEELGFSVYDATGQMHNMADIVEQLETITAGKSDKEKASILDRLGFKAMTQKAILPLIGTSKKIKGYEAALMSAGGTTGDIANKQMTAFSNQLKVTWNALQVVGIELGQVLAPTVTAVSEAVKGALLWWRGLGTETKLIAVAAGAAAAALGPLLLGVGMIGPTLAAGAGVITAVLAPLAPLIVAAGAATLAFIAYHGDIPTAFKALKDGAADAWGYVRSTTLAFVEWSRPVWVAVGELASSAWGVAVAATRWAAGLVRDGIAAVGSAASSAWSLVSGGAEVSWGRVRDAAEATFRFLSFSLQNFGQVAGFVWADFAHAAVQATNQVIYLFQDVLPYAVGWMGRNWRGVMTLVWDYTVKTFRSVADYLVELFKSIPWGRMWDGLKTSARAASEWTLGKMRSVFVDNLDPLLKGALSFVGLWGEGEGQGQGEAAPLPAPKAPELNEWGLEKFVLPDRVEGDLERRLREERDRLGAALEADWAAHWQRMKGGPLVAPWADNALWPEAEVSWLDDQFWKTVKKSATDSLVKPVEEATRAAAGLNAALFGSAEAQQRIEAYRASLMGAPTAGGMSARDELHGAISEVYESGNDDVVDAIGRVEELLKGKNGQVNVLGADLL